MGEDMTPDDITPEGEPEKVDDRNARHRQLVAQLDETVAIIAAALLEG